MSNDSLAWSCDISENTPAGLEDFSHIQVSTDGRFLLVVSRDDERAQLIRSSDGTHLEGLFGQQFFFLQDSHFHSGKSQSVTLATVDSDESIYGSGNGVLLELRDLDGDGFATYWFHPTTKGVLVSPGGQYIASYSDGQIVIRRRKDFPTRKGKPVIAPAWWSQRCSHIHSIAFSPDGKLLAACTRFGIRVWDISGPE